MTRESADSVITSWSLTGAGLLVGYVHQALGLLLLALFECLPRFLLLDT